MLSDSLFSDAGWLFFAILSIVIGTFSVTAFSSDVVQVKAHTASKPPAGRKA
jgi:hypothetical protein